MRSKIYIITAIIIFSCSQNKESEYKNSPRVKSYVKLTSPNSNEVFNKNDIINFIVDTNDKVEEDSSIIFFNNEKIVFNKNVKIETNSLLKFGKYNFKIKTWLSNNKIETNFKTIYLYPKEAPKELSYEITNIYPHDSEAYTQGLLIDINEKLYESTGQYGNSTLREVNLKTGKIIKTIKLEDKYFGEGITLYKNNIYLLTWKSNKGFVYDKNTFDKIDEFNYNTEGWGITTIKDKLVMSNGTENLNFINPNTYKIENQIQVYDNNGKVININELEFINDKIYANIYGKDIILIINYITGKVENFINLNNIFNKKNYTGKIDVLNGIATNNNKIYVTGKWWPSMFEIKIMNDESK